MEEVKTETQKDILLDGKQPQVEADENGAQNPDTDLPAYEDGRKCLLLSSGKKCWEDYKSITLIDGKKISQEVYLKGISERKKESLKESTFNEFLNGKKSWGFWLIKIMIEDKIIGFESDTALPRYGEGKHWCLKTEYATPTEVTVAVSTPDIGSQPEQPSSEPEPPVLPALPQERIDAFSQAPEPPTSPDPQFPPQNRWDMWRDSFNRREAFIRTMIGFLSFLAGFGGAWIQHRKDAPTENTTLKDGLDAMLDRTEAGLDTAIYKFGLVINNPKHTPEDCFQAQVGLATAFYLLGYYGFVSMSDAASFGRAVLNDAIEFLHDPERSYKQRLDFYLISAFGYLLEWNLTSAASDFRNAFEEEKVIYQDPHTHDSSRPRYSRSFLHLWYSLSCVIRNQEVDMANRFSEMFFHIGIACAIPSESDGVKEPTVIWKAKAQRYYYAGQYVIALNDINDLSQNEKDKPLVKYWKGLIEFQTDKTTGTKSLKDASDKNPNDYMVLGSYIYAYLVSDGDENQIKAEEEKLITPRGNYETYKKNNRFVIPQNCKDAITKYAEYKINKGITPYVSPVAVAMIAVAKYDTAKDVKQTQEAEAEVMNCLEKAKEEKCFDILLLNLEPRYTNLRQHSEKFKNFKKNTYVTNKEGELTSIK